MSVAERIALIRSLLDKLHGYQRMIDGNSFENSTVTDIKGNAKDLCDQVKNEINSIKTEIDQWQ